MSFVSENGRRMKMSRQQVASEQASFNLIPPQAWIELTWWRRIISWARRCQPTWLALPGIRMRRFHLLARLTNWWGLKFNKELLRERSNKQCERRRRQTNSIREGHFCCCAHPPAVFILVDPVFNSKLALLLLLLHLTCPTNSLGPFNFGTCEHRAAH